MKAQELWNEVSADGRTRNDAFASHRNTNWGTLAQKLRTLVRMRFQWGDLHSIYETRSESLYQQYDLDTCIRDPDSRCTRTWDALLVLLIVYVAVLVPLRTCLGRVVDNPAVAFGVLEQSASPGTLGFAVDLVVRQKNCPVPLLSTFVCLSHSTLLIASSAGGHDFYHRCLLELSNLLLGRQWVSRRAPENDCKTLHPKVVFHRLPVVSAAGLPGAHTGPE
eukprot:COSAG02_NODE_4001_length_5930_cov_20.519122_6_plen_221_part_00